MKRILSVFLCLIFICSITSCDTKRNPSDNEKSENTSKETDVVENIPYTFISKQERLSWKDKIIAALSVANPYEEIEPGILGAALMDLNFDNTPELIVVGAGGSMGNVYIAAYNIESGEKMCVLGYTPHYQDWNNVYFCLHRNNEGNYILVNEGSLRNGLEWYLITSKLTEDFKFDTIFEEVKTSNDDSKYYFDGNEVKKAEFEKQKEQFKNDYKAVTETKLKIIYWDSIEFETKSEAISKMADKLVNSEQQFIRFDSSTPTVDMNAQQTPSDYKQAYLDFLKDKKDSHRLFALVYLDDDEIPELYLMGAYEAMGDMVCSFKNGLVMTQQLKRTGDGKYIERGGSVINQNDNNMERCYTDVYKLGENGFTKTFNALSIVHVEYIGGKGSEEYRFIYEYFVGDAPVSETEYHNAINAAFDFSQAVRLDENAVSYEEIVQQLQNGNSKGK